MDRLAHVAPPINEIGFSVGLSAPGLIDHYDIRSLHLAMTGLPTVSQQASIASLDVAAIVGGASNALAMANVVPQRWWFGSEDETRVLQVQDDMLAFNWRRKDALPGYPAEYPGFEFLAGEFWSYVDRLRDWHGARGTILPNPSGCELIYDDIVVMETPGGQQFSMSETLTEFDRAEKDRKSSAWTMSWLERIDNCPDDKAILRIQLHQLGMVTPGRADGVPVMRMGFNAGAACQTWEEVKSFFEAAHHHIRGRFLALIDPKVQATWQPR